MLRSRRSAVLAAGAIAVLSACGMFDDLRPVDAHVSIDGEPGARVEVITSSTFVAGITEAGVTQVNVIVADTVYPALPFDETYRISSDQRFLVILSRFDEDVDSVHMQVFVNDDRKFNEGGALLADLPYRFLYTFNQPITNVIDVVF